MKPAVMVIGGRNAGKSTVIRSLTGCPRKGFKGIVEDRVTHKRIYTIAASPQEQRLDVREFRRILVQVVRDGALLGLIMAVQPTKPRIRLSLESIIRALKEAGHFNIVAILLDPPYDSVPKGRVDRHNLRKRLLALGVNLHPLNGRRFAHLSAVAIRKIARIP